ncbi:MAG TPA: pyridoxal-phosphate dependent enzyme, partial [bacterium]|nr:pyridoxal-phosphate dependent enzyme [bacterium]
STAANPVVRAWEERKTVVPQQVGYTIAEGVAVGAPGIKGDRALEAVRATEGLACSVDDAEIVDAMGQLARAEGIWSGPTGAVTVAALVRLVKEKKIPSDASAVCVVSETGLKGDFPPFPSEAQPLDAERILRILER